MQHILKKPVTQKLFAIITAAIMFLCAGFSGYAADGEGQGKAHNLTVSTQDVLSALALGALTAEETAEYVVEVPAAVVTGESEQPPAPDDPAIEQKDDKPYDGTSAQPAEGDVLSQSASSAGESAEGQGESEAAPSQSEGESGENQDESSKGSSQPESSNTSQPESSEISESEAPKQDAPAQVFCYQLDKTVIAVLERVKLPFGSSLMKAQLAQGLVGQRLVRFFDSGEIDATDCQAIVVIDPASEQVKVVAVNPHESGTQSLLLNIVDENGQPLRVNDALQNGMTADKKVLDGTVGDADLPDNALIEVLEINYAQNAQSSTPTNTSSAQEETSSEPAEVTSSVVEVPSVQNTIAPEAMSMGQNELESQDASSQEQTSSEETPSEVTSSEQANPSSDVPGGSSEPSEDTPSSKPSPDPIEQEIQTTILLLSPTSEKLEFSAFAAVPIEVGAGFSATTATVSSAFDVNTVQRSKTAQMVSEQDRTYQINLAAWAAAQPVSPVDIVLVLDASGSMPWLMTTPATRTTVSGLPNPNQHGYPHPEPRQYDFDYYKYFVLADDEYRPIEYLKQVPPGYSGTVQGAGWYRIESTSTGEKSIKAEKLTGNTAVYVKGENDKTKLDMLKESAMDFVANVAATSSQSRIAVVTFSNTGNTLLGLTQLSSTGVASVRGAIQNIRLTGNTNHAAGLTQAKNIIDSIPGASTRSKYVILFTDGQPVGGSTEQQAKDVATPLKAKCTLFTIGLYGGGLTSTQVSDLEGFLKSLATSASHYYNATSSGLGNVFGTIFANIVNGLTGAVITDVVNERFTLTEASKSALQNSGAAITTDSTGRDVITWNHQTIPASGSEASGWKRSFVVKARDNYVGGNNVPTNSAGSQITHSDYNFSKAFPIPKVDVPLRNDVAAKDAYLYIGDAVATDSEKVQQLKAPTATAWQTYGDTQIAYSLRSNVTQPNNVWRPAEDTQYRLVATVTPVSADGYAPAEFLSEAKPLKVLTPLIELTDTTIFAGDKTNLNDRVKSTEWQYKTNGGVWNSTIPSAWVYAGLGSGTAPTISYSYKLRATGEAVAAPTDLMLETQTDFSVAASRADVPDAFPFASNVRYQNKGKDPVLQNNNGWFTIFVRNGQISVTKQINDNWTPHGDPIFVYTLEKLGSDNMYHEVSSDFIRFTGGSSGVGNWVSGGNTAGTGERSVVFDRLGAGTYRLTELETIRYRLDGITSSANGSRSGKSVVFTIANDTPTGWAKFVNNKWINSWFSHTDVVKNSFTPDFAKQQ